MRMLIDPMLWSSLWLPEGQLWLICYRLRLGAVSSYQYAQDTPVRPIKRKLVPPGQSRGRNPGLGGDLNIPLGRSITPPDEGPLVECVFTLSHAKEEELLFF